MIQKIPDNDLSYISVPLMDSLPVSEANLKPIIRKALLLIKCDIYCIIDGIDESIDDWTKPDNGGLKLVHGLANSHSNIRLLLVGREAAMRSVASLVPLNLRIAESLVRSDIDQLILHQMDHDLKVQTASARKLIQESLQRNSKDMFLWVTLIFRELSRCQLSSEIIRTLEQIPQDLDREYSRLFIRFQENNGDNRSAPSIPMQRARCLLSLIIAAPEPLTIDELQQAFAITQHPNKGYEEYTISHDGIMDTCGDFIRVSDGRYHMTHASLVDFLTRPIDIWQHQDEAIRYFHIDIPQAHTNMSIACLNYFRFSDLGYPLVDGSLTTIHTRLPFLPCALKFTFIYLMNTYTSSGHSETWRIFVTLIETPQFWALVEYVLLSMRDEPTTSSATVEMMDFISWILPAPNRGLDSIEVSVVKSLEEELLRRRNTFGLNDDRYQTMECLLAMISPLFGQHSVAAVTSLSQVPTCVQHKATGNIHGNGSTAMDVLLTRPQGLEPTLQAMVLRLSQGTLSSDRATTILGTLASRLFAKPLELLPIPLLILLAHLSRQSSALKCWLTALKRLTGTYSLLEAYSALKAGQIYFEIGDSKAEGLFKRSLEIAAGLPPSLHVNMMIQGALNLLSWALLQDGKMAEAQKTSSQLRDHLSRGQGPGYTNMRLERKVWDSLFWDGWQATLLIGNAEGHLDYGQPEYALSIVESIIPRYENHTKRTRADSINAHYVRMRAQY
jgi:hypothetical protein